MVVPVNLGCCPEPSRCVLCAPPPAPPTAETVAALLDSYRRDRATPEDDVVVGFFGGAPPPDALVDAIAGAPFTVRVRPDLLSRSALDALVRRGAVGFELDALSFDDATVRRAGRAHRASLVRQIAGRITSLGLRCSIVLTPGLPGWTFDQCVEDARQLTDCADAARVLPVLVLEGSALAATWRTSLYRPMTLDESVSVCRAMLDILEASGVEVLRVGLQPGPDESGRALAGPVHSGFRELVEARRVLDRLRAMLAKVPAGARIEIHCAPADETRTRGPLNQHIRSLRAEFSLDEVRIAVDAELERGHWDWVIIPKGEPA